MTCLLFLSQSCIIKTLNNRLIVSTVCVVTIILAKSGINHIICYHNMHVKLNNNVLILIPFSVNNLLLVIIQL